MQVLLFDDGRADLGPLSDLRAAFDQRTGGWTLRERLAASGAEVHVACPVALAGPTAERAGPARGRLDVGCAIRCVNGRSSAGTDPALDARIAALGPGEALVTGDGSLLAVHLRSGDLGRFLEAVSAASDPLPHGYRTEAAAGSPWSRPWDLLSADSLGTRIGRDAEVIAASWRGSGAVGSVPAHAATSGPGPVHVHASARIGVGAVLDASAGPIVVSAEAQVGHGAVVRGPAWIGPRTIVADRALLKERTVLGPQCRAAGEVGSAIFQGCSNKAHDGHLGDALLGEWVNLGAGTVNSNLLNTYGEVTMRLRPGASMERTGRQFMGCVIGDHAKTAIGTRIMTGSSIGTGAMWAAGRAVSGAVAPFAWVTDDGERRFRLDKFQEIARTVMARRGAEPGPATVARLAALHAAAGG